MEINLLPQVPTMQKYRFQIAIVVGVIVILFSAFVGFQIWYKTNQIEKQKIILQQLKSERETKESQLNQEQRVIQFIKTYQKEYTRLKAADINWVPIVDELSKRLPSNGRIIQMNWSDDGTIKMVGDFSSLESIGQYLQLLNQLEWIEQVDFVNAQAQDQSTSGRFQVLLNVKINQESLYMINTLLGGDKK
ncbi:PilN domain-containing protein [Tepidibacillus sp. LV47]|uniref:PilN domain-containing protein n=1 Tax=Tepidibacillus sp. LV47 TaxID=3398228 RepID=UPI003AAB3E11